MATPWSVAESLVTTLQEELAGKILVDATNPIAPDFSGLLFGHKDSGGQVVARLAPGAKVVKGFNTVGFNIMADPSINGEPATLLLAGDDLQAKETVAILAKRIGFAPVDIGPISNASLVEASAWLWISLSQKIGRDFAFILTKRN